MVAVGVGHDMIETQPEGASELAVGRASIARCSFSHHDGNHEK